MFKKEILFLFFIVSITFSNFAQKQQIFSDCVLSIKDYGAVMDGKSDDYDAVMASLDDLNYAFIPLGDKGVKISKTIKLKPYQRIYGVGRGSKIMSEVPKGQFAILVEDVGFVKDAFIENISIIIESEDSNGVGILRSRNVFIDNIFINGNNKGNIGVQIDGGSEKGSAWNQVDKYTILKCKIGIELTSNTKLNFCNRNYIGYGVVQSCGIAVNMYKANTNTIHANPQGCPIGYKLKNSKFNRIHGIIENSKTKAISINKNSNNNIFSVGVNINKIEDTGKDNIFNLSASKQRDFKKRYGG